MKLFQSTQPKRAATDNYLFLKGANGISIHAAQEGCDKESINIKVIHKRFQSTQPKRAATCGGENAVMHLFISIHAAQEGCDCLMA